MTRRVGVLTKMAVVVLGAWSAGASPILTLIPSGTVVGYPGQTVGWGVQISNTSDTDWVVINFSEFCGAGVTDANVNNVDCSNNEPAGPYVPYDGVNQFGTSFGIYTDYLGPDAIVLAPFEQGVDTFFSFPFSPGNPGNGIGQYAISGAAKPNTDSGNLFVFYSLFLGDPRTGGAPDPNDPDNLEVSTVSNGGVSVTILPVPEPSTFLMVSGALLALVGIRWSRCRKLNNGVRYRGSWPL